MPSSRTVPQWTKSAERRGRLHGYRSGLEGKLGTQIEAEGNMIRYEGLKVPYVIPESLHSYKPDFELDNGIIIEGKGIFDAQDRAKHLLIQAQHPSLDIRFVFTNSKAPITPGSKTSLADWCKKFGFKFADKLIPASWFREAGPEVKPQEVIKLVPNSGARRKRAS